MEKIEMKQIIDDFKDKKTPCFVNGYGLGRITFVGSDYLTFVVTKKKEETKKRKNNATGKMENYTEKRYFKEVMYIKLNDKLVISEGEKELQKSETDQQLDNDLGDL